VDPLPGTARIPNGFGCAGRPRSLLVPCPAACIVCTLRDGAAGSLTSSGPSIGLDGPMPVTIALVVMGRCRPSPDRVSEGASSDCDARGIVTGGGAAGRGHGLLPVLCAPPGGVGRVNGHDREAEFGGHGDEPGLELAGGDAGDQLAEPLAPAVFLAGLLRGEVQILNTDRVDAAALAQRRRRVRACRICASRRPAVPDRS
jgi:hypothetical protein